MTTKVLIVDDHPAIRTTMKDVLENEGFETVLAESGERAVEIDRNNYFDFVLMDMQMPGIKGVDAFRQMLQGEQKHARFIFITAFSSPELENPISFWTCWGRGVSIKPYIVSSTIICSKFHAEVMVKLRKHATCDIIFLIKLRVHILFPSISYSYPGRPWTQRDQ